MDFYQLALNSVYLSVLDQADIEIDDEFQGPIPATSSGCNVCKDIIFCLNIKLLFLFVLELGAICGFQQPF